MNLKGGEGGEGAGVCQRKPQEPFTLLEIRVITDNGPTKKKREEGVLHEENIKRWKG
jgi:hypothetical protein